MWLVPGAAWKIIFPTLFCLAKADMEPNAAAERMGKLTATLPDTINGETSIAQALQCMNGFNNVENASTVIIVITVPKNSTVATAQENTTNFPGVTMPITVMDNTTTTEGYSITISDPGGTLAGGEMTTDLPAPGVSSTASEEVTKNILQNVIHTASAENPYTVFMTASGPGGAATPNGDATAGSEEGPGSLGELSTSQEDVVSEVTSGAATLRSTENTISTVMGKTVTQGRDNTADLAKTIGNAPEVLPNNIQGNPECYSECEVIPRWGTVLLCLGTAFFIFTLVGLLFVLPYCTKFRCITTVSSSSSPRCSV